MIFYHDDYQKQEAEKSKEDLEKSRLYDKPIVTEIRKAETFYPAEDYHQYYYKKNPDHYNRYYINTFFKIIVIFIAKRWFCCRVLCYFIL